ncbi:hypothetical protein O181_036209 [Austropuccinia psidii MF-1]|uniref:C2H2-type domain-containing protein n=1 Tax=Austropuccinia psidii MF-1 TaxID=1389203 RepID=A0A9Q3HBB4_9BASI|nr:hypothetical protein [Austropuccinia psidii MF-1]
MFPCCFPCLQNQFQSIQHPRVSNLNPLGTALEPHFEKIKEVSYQETRRQTAQNTPYSQSSILPDLIGEVDISSIQHSRSDGWKSEEYCKPGCCKLAKGTSVIPTQNSDQFLSIPSHSLIISFGNTPQLGPAFPPQLTECYGPSETFDLSYSTLTSSPLSPFPLSDMVESAPFIEPYVGVRFYDGYSPVANFESESMQHEGKFPARLRTTSINSSPPRYTLNDEKRYSFPNIQSYASPEYSSFTSSFHGHLQPTDVYNREPENKVTSPYQLTGPPEPQEMGFSHPNTGYLAQPEPYQPALYEKFLKTNAKTPTYCSERPFKCDKCTASFSRNHDLKRHARIHLAIKPFPCEWCEKAFSRKDALKRHLLVKGCSKNKEVSIQNLHFSAKSKSLLNQTSFSKRLHRDHQSWLSSTYKQRAADEISKHHQKFSHGTFSGSKNSGAPLFDQINLQNISCSIPSYI